MRRDRLSRRAFVRGSIGAALAPRRRTAAAASVLPASSLPIGLAGRVLGSGFLIRHGYACENTWYAPGNWHTGEDWYLLAGNTAGAGVYAVASGEVVFADSDYPGLVVIVRHGEALYSMYGHLDYALAIALGDRVARGQLLGRVLDRTDGLAPSHLHFELRTFLTTPEVNGAAPRYGFACGVDCPPGPGYWPIGAPEHPSAMGWRNPTHGINRRAWPDGVPAGAEVVVAAGAPARVATWTAPAGREDAANGGELALAADDRYPLLAIDAGAEATTGTSAEAYRLWYQLGLPDGGSAWVQAAVPAADETGSDGRPSSVRFVLLPAVSAPAP